MLLIKITKIIYKLTITFIKKQKQKKEEETQEAILEKEKENTDTKQANTMIKRILLYIRTTN